MYTQVCTIHELQKIAGKGLNQNTHNFAHAVSHFCILHILLCPFFVFGIFFICIGFRASPVNEITFVFLHVGNDLRNNFPPKMCKSSFQTCFGYSFTYLEENNNDIVFFMKTPPFPPLFFQFLLFSCVCLFVLFCLPCSCFLRFLRLQILTVQTDTIIATMKKSTPPEKSNKS